MAISGWPLATAILTPKLADSAIILDPLHSDLRRRSLPNNVFADLWQTVHTPSTNACGALGGSRLRLPRLAAPCLPAFAGHLVTSVQPSSPLAATVNAPMNFSTPLLVGTLP